jgi:hypothetical protein
MSNPIFMPEGLETATITASSGSAEGYPTTNLKDRKWATKWVSGNTTSDQTLQMDLTDGRQTNAILIDNHNIASLGGVPGVLIIEYYNGGWLTEYSGLFTSIPSPFYLAITHISTQYRLRFNRGAGLLVAPSIGMIFLGKRIDLPLYNNHPQRGLEADAEVDESLSGLRFGSSVRADREKFSFIWGAGITQAIEAEYYRLIRKANGRQYPFYFADMNGYWHLGRFDKNYLPLIGSGNKIFKSQAIEISEERVGIIMQLPGGYSVAP